MAQTCGRVCVFCAVALSTETAVELGSRTDVDFTWFPRSCRLCVVRPAYRAVLDHTQQCMQCADNPALCADGYALRHALNEVRR
ncbi:hypothetical protein ACFVXC_15090 [Streptomyces sp. NPDC058257]|uniref:hypothetical protein n=1 Tax=Streptomyces sp. NPDC058257 TaxID=3346409 RepID=UPI0036E8E610